MKKSVIYRICTVLVLVLSPLMLMGQDIVSSINAQGNVNVTVPEGLTTRNNNDVQKKTSVVRAEEDDNSVKKETKTESTRNTTATSKQTVQGHKVGFRIQVFNESSANAKADAQNRARAIAMRFPQYRTYLSYNAPAWRLRIGDFKDQGEAAAALSRVRSAFPAFSGQMMLVKDNVNVWSK